MNGLKVGYGSNQVKKSPFHMEQPYQRESQIYKDEQIVDRTESSHTHNESDSMISAAVKTTMTEVAQVIDSI